MSSPPTLYLIDGYAQFFRAYHAIRSPMTSPVTREPTNLTFGFVGMLLKLLRGEGKVGGTPDYIAVALDVSGDRETFRSEIYPEYKANRPPPPEDLFPQVQRCLSLLEAIGVPCVGVEGFEADDVIATLVTRLQREHPDLRIRLVSKDKDLKQLLAASPSIGAPVEMYDVHTDDLIDAAALKADTGLDPSQVVDMLALMGDTVDNVPGVEGIGPKTAAALITQYGSLENLIAHADEVKGKRGEALRATIGRLPLSQQLVMLRHDAPVEFDLAAARTANLRLEKLLPILRELGFNRYQDELKALTGKAGRAGSDAQGSPAGVPAAQATPDRAQASGPAFTGGLFDAVGQSTPASVTSVVGDYRCIRTSAQLNELIAELRAAPIVSVDTETTGLSPLRCKLCGISLATVPGRAVYIPVRSPKPADHLDERTILDALRPILEDPAKPKTGHNLKYDLLVLHNHGLELRGLAPAGCASGAGTAQDSPAPPEGSVGFDSMVASYLIDAARSSHSLDALALALLHRSNISIKDLIGTGPNQRTFDQVPLDQAVPYAAEDADVALQLRERLLPQLRAMGLMDLFAKVELPLVEVLAELEWNGIQVDPAELDRQRARLADRIEELRRQINDAAMAGVGRTFNPDSPRQLAAILFNAPDDATEGVGGGPGLGLRPVKRIKTGHSTDSEVLEKMAADPSIATPIPALVLEHRELMKLVGTYLVALKDEINPATGRIHASFNQTGAVTGRLSSSDPNLQNIPIRTDLGREIRRAFVAPPGRVLISADYSQIELRLLAHLSKDPALTAAFHEGQDIHTAVAAQIHGVRPEEVTKSQRNGAKMVNFGIVYGITPYGLARRLGIGNAEAESIIDGYKRRFAGITTFLQECIGQAKRYGYVETMLKRRRPIADVDSTNPSRRALAERMAINSVVQGSAADLIKIAMVDLHGRLSEHAGHWRGPSLPPPALPGVKMLLQIHDELVFEAPVEVAAAARDLIVSRMEQAMRLSVPLKADANVAKNWIEGKS